MNWENARKICESDPWVKHELGGLVLSWHGNYEDEIRREVTENVRYIAFRPFESLNLLMSPEAGELTVGIHHQVTIKVDVQAVVYYVYGFTIPRRAFDYRSEQVQTFLINALSRVYHSGKTNIRFTGVAVCTTVRGARIGAVHSFDLFKFPDNWNPESAGIAL